MPATFGHCQAFSRSFSCLENHCAWKSQFSALLNLPLNLFHYRNPLQRTGVCQWLNRQGAEVLILSFKISIFPFVYQTCLHSFSNLLPPGVSFCPANGKERCPHLSHCSLPTVRHKINSSFGSTFSLITHYQQEQQ